MSEKLHNHRRLLDRRDDVHLSATARALLGVNIEHPLE
jgi:hypothetical protein